MSVNTSGVSAARPRRSPGGKALCALPRAVRPRRIVSVTAEVGEATDGGTGVEFLHEDRG